MTQTLNNIMVSGANEVVQDEVISIYSRVGSKFPESHFIILGICSHRRNGSSAFVQFQMWSRAHPTIGY